MNHLGQITASFSDNAPLVAETLMTLIESMKKDFLRIKGCVFISGKSQIWLFGILRGTNSITSLWKCIGAILFLKQKLFLLEILSDEAALQRKLWSCHERLVPILSSIHR